MIGLYEKEGLSIEQCEWLERKGVVEPWLFELVRQTETKVYIRRRDLGLTINRNKDVVGQRF